LKKEFYLVDKREEVFNDGDEWNVSITCVRSCSTTWKNLTAGPNLNSSKFWTVSKSSRRRSAAPSISFKEKKFYLKTRWFIFTCSLTVFNANEHPTSFKYQQTSLTFHVIGFRGSIGGGIGYWIGRDCCWTSNFGIDTFEDELKSLKDWDIGSGYRFFLFLFDGDKEFLFEDKIFNVTDDGERIGGDIERFFGIRKRFVSK